ncbi:MAG: glycosyltransferase [Acidobacteria bacterium]|nr:glycosyltransferase [Acidobacteriota bacterium]
MARRARRAERYETKIAEITAGSLAEDEVPRHVRCCTFRALLSPLDVRRELQRTRSELSKTRAELEEVRRVLRAVEASRFWKLRNLWWRTKERAFALLGLTDRMTQDTTRVLVPAEPPEPPLSAADPRGVPSAAPVAPSRSAAPVDIVVCIHDAYDDVVACIDSVVSHTRPPYTLILVDDGSATKTRDHVEHLARALSAVRIRNEEARGYTLAANQGLRASTGEYVVLLNSDTVVTPGWLGRLIGCAESDPAIGLVGPLSNCASWQSVPEVFDAAGDWAENPLPTGVTPDAIASALGAMSGPVYPRIPFLNGFCLLIKRATIEALGRFDEETFGRGYGEENDYALRARAAGFALAVADDAYVVHRQSRSYSHERRKLLSEAAGAALNRKHGGALIEEGVRVCRSGRVMEAMRERSRLLLDRRARIARGRERFEGKRVLFVLPVTERGGGANVVISEARAMSLMGVDARLLNRPEFLPFFERHYPEPGLPIESAPLDRLAEFAKSFDAVIATVNTSVAAIAPLAGKGPVLGYYVQDFEPAFYEAGSPAWSAALASYTGAPGLVRLTKTEWNRAAVLEGAGVDCTVIGPSYEADLFRPYREAPVSSPVKIAAMVRPSTPRRQPELTVDVLGRLHARFGERVAITVFGFDPAGPDAEVAKELPATVTRAGLLDGAALAALFNDTHVFADLSSFQAMGLTALEALGCGATAVVPRSGGANAFARHEENALVVDTLSADACFQALCRLVEDDGLRSRLMDRGYRDVCRFHPVEPALRILEALFPEC